MRHFGPALVHVLDEGWRWRGFEQVERISNECSVGGMEVREMQAYQASCCPRSGMHTSKVLSRGNVSPQLS